MDLRNTMALIHPVDQRHIHGINQSPKNAVMNLHRMNRLLFTSLVRLFEKNKGLRTYLLKVISKMHNFSKNARISPYYYYYYYFFEQFVESEVGVFPFFLWRLKFAPCSVLSFIFHGNLAQFFLAESRPPPPGRRRGHGGHGGGQ